MKQRLLDNFIQNWRSRLDLSSRALFYREIAGNFEFKSYLKSITVPKLRESLTKLRMSSHYLAVETGRWHKPLSIPFNERKCTICSCLEDEFHFVIKCSLYVDLRKKYIDAYFWKNPSMFKFIDLVMSTDETTVRKLGLFLTKAFVIKKNTIGI